MPKLKVLRPFNSTPQGGLVDVGDTIEVEDTRAGELARLGLAEIVKEKAKAAPEHENKMAAAPPNKAEGITAAARVERAARRTVALERK